MLISCLTYSSTPKMEAICSSETSVDLKWGYTLLNLSRVVCTLYYLLSSAFVWNLI
jgi:hypothetical protein